MIIKDENKVIPSLPEFVTVHLTIENAEIANNPLNPPLLRGTKGVVTLRSFD